APPAGAGLIAQAKSLAAMGQFADASARLEAAHDLLVDALEQAEAAQGKPKTGPDLAAQWKKNLAEWTPALKAALAAKGPNAPAIGKLLAQATALSKPRGDLAQALKKLTECHALATSGAPEAAEHENDEKVATEAEAAPDTEPETPAARWDAER